jgi:hypothetical protein
VTKKLAEIDQVLNIYLYIHRDNNLWRDLQNSDSITSNPDQWGFPECGNPLSTENDQEAHSLKAAICCSLFVRSRVYWNRDREPRTLSTGSLRDCYGAGCLPKGNKPFDNNTRIWTFVCEESGIQLNTALDQNRTEAVTKE